MGCLRICLYVVSGYLQSPKNDSNLNVKLPALHVQLTYQIYSHNCKGFIQGHQTNFKFGLFFLKIGRHLFLRKHNKEMLSKNRPT